MFWVATSNVRTQQLQNNTSVINIDTMRLPSTTSQIQRQNSEKNQMSQHIEIQKDHQNIIKTPTGLFK